MEEEPNGGDCGPSPPAPPPTLSLATLATLRSLILNPDTPQPLLNSLLQTLTLPHNLSHHSPSLLASLALNHPRFTPLVIPALLSVLSGPPALTLPLLSSLRKLSPSSLSDIDDRSFVGFCWSEDVGVRKWVAENVGLFTGVGRHVMGMVLAGMAGDPFPEVRRGALEGLVRLKLFGGILGDDEEIMNGCFWRGVEMLSDVEDSVRRAAIRVVSEWGQMLSVCKQGEEKRVLSDVVFIQLCSMARDMSVEVRIEAFNALEKMEVVSSDLLLQSLSKRVLNVMKENRAFGQSTGQIKHSASNVAGALVHGLEDEFYEVRRSVCHSLQRLSTLSSEFAVEVVNYLMELLNDDHIAVRLEVLDTMHCMADHDHLFVPAAHMHMFLGCLNDNTALIRDAVRKVMKVAKLSSLDLFKSSVHGLIKNLEAYPQDEADVLSALFHIGRHHGDFLICIFSEVSHEIEPASDGSLNFDCARVAALLVLAMSAPLSHERNTCEIPAAIFSYTVTLLGRISHALTDIIDKEGLLVYFSQCSRCMNHSVAELRDALSVKLAKGETSRMFNQSVLEPNGILAAHAEYQPHKSDDLLTCLKVIFTDVMVIWPSIKSGGISEVLRTLRVYEEQLISLVTVGYCATLSFTIRYVQTLKLLAEIWSHILPTRLHRHRIVGAWEILMVKLGRTLRDMRCTFVGFSKEEDLHFLELVSVALLLKLSKIESGSHAILALRKLSTVWSQVEHFLEENAIKPTPFLSELKNMFPKSAYSEAHILCIQSLCRKTVDYFFPMRFELSGSLDMISVELAVPNNSSEDPQVFVQGLPVAIPLEITLRNVSKECRLWLKMTILGKELQQFVFLDQGLLFPSGSNRRSKSTYFASFCRTPKTHTFTLTVCVGMECMLEDVAVDSGRCWGPKRELTFLCPVKEVYLSSSRTTNQKVP